MDEGNQMNVQQKSETILQEQPGDVVGIYSFPRSGNTWLRHLVASAFGTPGDKLQRYVPDMHFGPVNQTPLVRGNKRWYFYKSHHKDVVTENRGQPIRTDKIVYIYRHPLDVFISYLNFASKNVNSKLTQLLQFEIESVEKLSPEQLESLFHVYMVFGTITPQNRAYGGYFEHVYQAFHLRDSGFPIHIMRYEDLAQNFVPTAGAMFDFLGVEGLDLEQLYAEADKRTAQDGKFFWKRQMKTYQNFLTPKQVEAYYNTFRDKLMGLGYAYDDAPVAQD